MKQITAPILAVLILTALPASLPAGEIAGECKQIFAVSASAIANKNKGITKQKMASALPAGSKSSRQEPLRSMHEILDEVYDHKPVDQFVYSVYRTELCHRRVQGKPVPSGNYSKIRKQLETCARKSSDKAECAMRVAGSKGND